MQFFTFTEISGREIPLLAKICQLTIYGQTSA